MTGTDDDHVEMLGGGEIRWRCHGLGDPEKRRTIPT
jgi:hypothetical protein